MAAVSSESVDTMTRSNTPLSIAGAIVYASIGCPCSTRRFLPGTRLEPWRAGIRHTQFTLHVRRVVVDVNGLEIGIDVQGLRACFAPAVARLAQPAERHMWLATVCASVHDGDAGLDAADERHRPVDVLGVNRRRQSERRVVRQRHGFLEILHPVQARDWSEEFASRDLVIRTDVLDDR